MAADILILSPGGTDGKGGMGRFVRYLAATLAAMPGAPRLAVIDSYGPGKAWAMPWYFLKALGAMARQAFAGASVAHIHMACYGSALRKGIALHAARALGLKTILHLHGADFDSFFLKLAPFWRGRLLAVLQAADRVVVIGNHWAGFVTTTLGLPAAKVRLIVNGVPDPGRLPAAPVDDGPCRLLALGELGPRKGTPEIIEAAAGDLLARRNIQVTLAGNGPVDEYRRTVAARGLGGRMALPGWVSATDAQSLLRDCHIFLLPSRDEGLPIAILEAMAAGRAIVATPVGAIPDAIEDGVTGLVVPPGDAGALASALDRLIGDPALRQRLGDAARTRFEQAFTIERAAAACASLYAELGAGPRSGG